MSGAGKVRLTLQREPDGYGFRYGTAETPDGEVYRVNIMPPKAHWQGDAELPGYEPHETDWVVYVDGEEVARVTSRADMDHVLAGRLAALAADNPSR